MAVTEINTCCYLHGQKSEVSKMLVETSNLVIMNPGQVIWGPLGKKKKKLKLRIVFFVFFF